MRCEHKFNPGMILRKTQSLARPQSSQDGSYGRSGVQTGPGGEMSDK